MRFCIYEISQYSFFALCSFCLTKPGQRSTFNFPSLSLRVSVSLSTHHPLSASAKMVQAQKRCENLSICESIQRSSAFIWEFFQSQQNPSRSLICFSLWRDTSSYWANRPSIILIDYSFMLFRSVKCHWSFIVRWMVSLQLSASFPSVSDPSINQSVKALSTAISHSGQDSDQDVHPHTHSNLPLELPNQRAQAVHQSRASSKGNPNRLRSIYLSISDLWSIVKMSLRLAHKKTLPPPKLLSALLATVQPVNLSEFDLKMLHISIWKMAVWQRTTVSLSRNARSIVNKVREELRGESRWKK